MAELNDIINRCAEELPGEYSIEISVENGSACVHLLDESLDCIECFEIYAENGLVEGAVFHALKRAKEMASNPTGEAVN